MGATAMRVAFVFGMSLIVLSGCVTMGGNGPVTMSNTTFNSYQRYLTEGEPLAFALSEDGGASSYFYCIEIGCSAERYKLEAVNRCEARSKGVKCHAFDIKGVVVWDNPGQWDAVKDANIGVPQSGGSKVKIFKTDGKPVMVPKDWISQSPLKLDADQFEVYNKYLEQLKKYPDSAFFIAGNGSYGWQTSTKKMDGALQKAFDFCKINSGKFNCYIYAVGDLVVTEAAKK